MRDGCVEMTGRGAALGHDPETPLSHRAVSLIATYEEMYRVPEARRVTYYFGDYGGHFLKYGTAEAAALTAYDKALAAIQMDDGAFRQAAEFNYRGGIIARMWRCMLGEDAHLQRRSTSARIGRTPSCCMRTHRTALFPWSILPG